MSDYANTSCLNGCPCSTELPLQAPWSNADRRIRRVSLGAPVLPGMRCSSSAASHCLRAASRQSWCLLESSSFLPCPDHLDDSRSLPLPHGLPLVGASSIVPQAEKMGYSGPHCLAHYWSRPGVQAREGGLETLKPPACVMRQVPAPFSTCCLLCTFSSNILPRVFTCHQREGLALTESFYFTKGRATEQGKVGRKGVWQAGLEAVGFFGASFGDRRPLHGFLHFLHV